VAAPIPLARVRIHAAAIDRCFLGKESMAAPAPVPADNSVKRLADFLIAALLLIALSPAMALIACLVRLDGGPVLFGHRRVGVSGDVFRCWKFRTMIVDADTVLTSLLESDPQAQAEWQRDFKLRCDPRVTRVGRFLRVTSLDELPQLFNVLKGDMSVVGPRPIVADEIKRYGAAFHDYARCRPGITGVWQVSGRNDVDYLERVQLDQDYARKWSLAHDCRILLKTPAAVLHKNGAY
jgi:undecaprenyl-phosphate galactose phosphotransferase